jgi:DNA-binding protein HU-beta
MNRAQVVDGVQKKIGLSRAATERAVLAVLDVIAEGLKTDKNVLLVGFGTFKVKERKARTGRNPQTGGSMFIQASKTVGFKPSKTLKDTL